MTLLLGACNGFFLFSRFRRYIILLSLEGLQRNPQTKGGEIPMLFAPKEKGQGLVEYALILVLVAVVVIAVLMILGPIIGNVFSRLNSNLTK
jgi:pilus assembly protein Flp/PilA